MDFIGKDDLDIDEFIAADRRKRSGRNLKVASVLPIIGCVAAFILVMITCIVLYLRIDDGQPKEQETMVNSEVPVMYTQEEMEAKALLSAQTERQKVLDQLAEELNSGKTVVETLRTLYTDNIVVASSGKYHFIPISDQLKKHNYSTENLLISDREIAYAVNGQTISHKGIDVSKYNGVIDWSQVAADGVEFAFIRVGIRGYGAEGRLVEDEGFEENVESAIKSGIKVGVYFFTQAVNEVEAVEEASMTLSLIKKYKISYPVFLDVEASGGRADGIDRNTRTKVIKAYCETIRNSGYTAGVYANKTWLNSYMNAGELGSYKIWLAQYNTAPTYTGKFDMWQYSSKGSVAGISGNTDMNLSYMGY